MPPKPARPAGYRSGVWSYPGPSARSRMRSRPTPPDAMPAKGSKSSKAKASGQRGPGVGRKPKDGPVKVARYEDLSILQALFAAEHGRFPADQADAGHALVGLAELARRGDVSNLNVGFSEGMGRNIRLCRRNELEQAVSEAAPLLARYLFAPGTAAHLRLRELADLIEARPVHEYSGFMVLRSADPNRRAAADLMWEALEKLKDMGDGPWTESEIRSQIEAMPPGERLARLRQRGAAGDDKTLRRVLRQVLKVALAPGRPRQPAQGS